MVGRGLRWRLLENWTLGLLEIGAGRTARRGDTRRRAIRKQFDFLRLEFTGVSLLLLFSFDHLLLFLHFASHMALLYTTLQRLATGLFNFFFIPPERGDSSRQFYIGISHETTQPANIPILYNHFIYPRPSKSTKGPQQGKNRKFPFAHAKHTQPRGPKPRGTRPPPIFIFLF